MGKSLPKAQWSILFVKNCSFFQNKNAFQKFHLKYLVKQDKNLKKLFVCNESGTYEIRQFRSLNFTLVIIQFPWSG